MRASLVAFDGLAARSVLLGPEPARLEVDRPVARELRLTFPDRAPPRVRVFAKDGAFAFVAEVSADGVVPFVTGPGAFAAVVAPEFGLRAPVAVRSGPDGTTEPATFSEAALATLFESHDTPSPAVRLHVAARLTTTRAGSGPGPWLGIADPPTLPFARTLELPWGEDSEGLGFEVIAVAAEGPPGTAPSAVAVAWTNVMAIDDPTRSVGIGRRTLRPTLVVDVIDAAGSALPGVALDMTFDAPCLLRREDGRFEPGKPSTTWSVRSDAGGRFTCYADRAATHFSATWSSSDEAGGRTSGSGTWSGSPLTHAWIEAR